MVNGEVLEALNPYGHFEPHTYQFTASTSGQATIHFENTGPAGDQAVFVDNVQVCVVPVTSTSTLSTVLTTTNTQTTHTIYAVS